MGLYASHLADMGCRFAGIPAVAMRAASAPARASTCGPKREPIPYTAEGDLLAVPAFTRAPVRRAAGEGR